MSKKADHLADDKTAEPSKKPSRSFATKNPILRFSSMAIQMGVIIGLAAWGGTELDARAKNEKPIYTIVLCLVGIGISLYLVIKDATKLSNDEK